MLSRIGNSLFWMGRYIERAEHIARYTKVQYLSSVDAPLAQSRDFVLESILHMAGNAQGYYQTHRYLDEDKVICFTALAESNSYSLQSYISKVRENARGARDSISTELWESINRFYHIINAFNASRLHKKGLEGFARLIEENSYVIKGYIDNTLIRNEVWLLISLGIHLERAIQVSLILQTKLSDIEKIDPSEQGGALENYQWTTTLESAESFDMYMRCHKTSPTRRNVLDFLLFEAAFPKSIAYSLDCVEQCIRAISFQEEKKKGSINFMAGKLASQFQYITIEEVEDKAAKFLASTLNNIYELAHILDVKYLNYS